MPITRKRRKSPKQGAAMPDSVNYPIFDALYSEYPNQVYQVYQVGDELQIKAGIILVEDEFTGELEVHVPADSPFQTNPVFKNALTSTAQTFGVTIRNKVESKHKPKKEKKNG
jgi:hypothetical protein